MPITPTPLGVRQVHVWRGDRHVLKGVSLAVAAGELLHVSGPNGAGRARFLRVICGLLRPEEGEVSGAASQSARTPCSFQAEMAYASHEPALKGD